MITDNNTSPMCFSLFCDVEMKQSITHDWHYTSELTPDPTPPQQSYLQMHTMAVQKHLPHSVHWLSWTDNEDFDGNREVPSVIGS